jgi:hypothetical protein
MVKPQIARLSIEKHKTGIPHSRETPEKLLLSNGIMFLRTFSRTLEKLLSGLCSFGSCNA